MRPEVTAASGDSVYSSMRGQSSSTGKVGGRSVLRPAGGIAGADADVGAAMLRVGPSRWKRRLVSVVRWSLLVDALVFASAGLLTILPWPVWTPAMGRAWPVGMVVPEIALWLVPLPVCFAAAALWLGRGRGRRRGGWLTGITV